MLAPVEGRFINNFMPSIEMWFDAHPVLGIIILIVGNIAGLIGLDEVLGKLLEALELSNIWFLDIRHPKLLQILYYAFHFGPFLILFCMEDSSSPTMVVSLFNSGQRW